ncbi:MAG: hypothetical protein DDT19_00737 [Syntrophomonadaceae bacterium]|nr:hypothetical protein [Bacillota bacterium]
MARVVAVSVSEKKGMRKTNVKEAWLEAEHGIIGDAHAGHGHRQISLLAKESIEKMQALGLDVSAGDFAENLTTEGIELPVLPLGAQILVGNSVALEVTQIGKTCHERCAIYYQAGDCVMPKEGIFARVLKGGRVASGDEITIIIKDR